MSLAEAGADVIVTSRTLPTLEKVADQIRAQGRKSLVLDCDVSNIKDVQQMVKRAHNAMGRIDILVNNAGVVTRKPALEVTEKEWDSVVNTIGPGYYKTQQTALLFADKVWTKKTLARIPPGRFGVPEDLTGVVVFLASDASDYYLIGQMIFIDGGFLTT